LSKRPLSHIKAVRADNKAKLLSVRISEKTVFFLLGEIVENGNTKDIFSFPKDKRTEDYITGRFG
jgi:ABC-type phosphate transport system ATPase subunit